MNNEQNDENRIALNFAIEMLYKQSKEHERQIGRLREVIANQNAKVRNLRKALRQFGASQVASIAEQRQELDRERSQLDRERSQPKHVPAEESKVTTKAKESSRPDPGPGWRLVDTAAESFEAHRHHAQWWDSWDEKWEDISPYRRAAGIDWFGFEYRVPDVEQ